MKNKVIIITSLCFLGGILLAFNVQKTNQKSIFRLNLEALTQGEENIPTIPCKYKKGGVCRVLIQHADGVWQHVDYQDMEKV